MLSYLPSLPFGRKKPTAKEAPEATATTSDSAASKAAQAETTDQPTTSADPVPQAQDARDVRSPVLDPSDEAFLAAEMQKAESEPPVVIFEGNSGTTTPATASGVATPSINTAAEDSGENTPETEDTNEAAKGKEPVKDQKANYGAYADMATTFAKSQYGSIKRTASTALEKTAEARKARADKKAQEKKEKEEKLATEKAKKEAEKEAKRKEKGKAKETQPEEPVEEGDAELRAALDRLNLSTEGGVAFALSEQTRKMLSQFTLILKDLVAGGPHAYNDLTTFLDESSSQLEETFTNLPSFLQKLVKTLPAKFQNSLTPEALRALAASAPAAAVQAEKLGTMPSLKEMVTKPGLLMGMLRSVLNVLKTRFPMLMGANVAYSFGLFVVLLVLWYCYKRGREERLKAEILAAEAKVEEALGGGDESTTGGGVTATEAQLAEEAGEPDPVKIVTDESGKAKNVE